jgi:hypothetical protein
VPGGVSGKISNCGIDLTEGDLHIFSVKGEPNGGKIGFIVR